MSALVKRPIVGVKVGFVSFERRVPTEGRVTRITLDESHFALTPGKRSFLRPLKTESP